MERLLDFSQPTDINLLDQVVTVFYTGSELDRNAANAVLTRFQDHPDAWMRTDKILEYSHSPYSKFFALQVLGQAIKTRWRTLPREQREGIKNYIIQLIFKLSSDENILAAQVVLVNKLDSTLVQIIKQEWPHHWPNLVSELCGSSRTSESLCQNNMVILRMLSEEVFDFQGDMTSAKAMQLKTQFNMEFMQIFQLCEFVLENATKPTLVLETLRTLLKFLNWIPLGYIFETKLIDRLLYKFLPVPIFRNVVVQCLGEIAQLQLEPQYDFHFVRLYSLFMQELRKIIVPEADIPGMYSSGAEDFQEFISSLNLLLCGFFRAHLRLVEKPDMQGVNLDGHKYIMRIAQVEEVEVFKVCLEYIQFLAENLYNENPVGAPPAPLLLGSMGAPGYRPVSPRRMLYAPILSMARRVLVSRMPRPEEVLVDEEDGEVRKVTRPDTDAIALYNNMRETLIYLTHLDYDDTQHIMLDKLALQVDGTEWSWYNLNTLCWAIGSISGALPEDDEKRFLVTVIRELLGLVDLKRGKDNKAVIASNIMYVVGQYPRFLSAHWRFLKTVVNKLFEFMHETHPGVQDMACDTFLKISQKCRRKFVVVQLGETMPFIDELLANLQTHTSELEPHQVQTFYEAVGNMVQAQADAATRENLLGRLMMLPNNQWRYILAQAQQSMDVLHQPSVAKDLAHILKINIRVCLALGPAFLSQLGNIYLDLLNLYKAYSELMATAVASGQPYILDTNYVRAMRTCKRDVLRLVHTFVERAVDTNMIAQAFLAPLCDAVLPDYRRMIPGARDHEVLQLFTLLANRLRNAFVPFVPQVLQGVFQETLSMINRTLEDFPDIRLAFFELLRAINLNCFPAVLNLGPDEFKLFVDSAMWAVKHMQRPCMETGLHLVNELLHNMSASPVAQLFYERYLLPILQDMLSVLTDTFHMQGFKQQAGILHYIFRIVENGTVTVPLWQSAGAMAPMPNNQTFLRDYVYRMLVSAFPNLSPVDVERFVVGLFDQSRDLPAFQVLLRDFLVQMKEFTVGENAGLYEEERQVALEQRRAEDMKRQQAVPGLLGPAAADDTNML